jgi:hypothetical protein
LIRRLRIGRKTDQTAARAEDKLPPGWLNGLLKWQFVRLAMSWLPMPFGVSLVLVARRR